MGKNNRGYKNKKQSNDSAPSTSNDNRKQATLDQFVEKAIDTNAQPVSKQHHNHNHNQKAEKAPEKIAVEISSTPEKSPVAQQFQSPTVNFGVVYPEQNELENDADCLVPTQSPLPKGEAEKIVTHPEIYPTIASPFIQPKETQPVDESFELEKPSQVPVSEEGTESADHSTTWKDMIDDDVSVITDHLHATPERVPEKSVVPSELVSSNSEKNLSFSEKMKQSREEEGRIYNNTDNSTDHYDIMEDYLASINHNMIKLLVFLKPWKSSIEESGNHSYEQYLHAKIDYVFWPFTLVFPSFMVEAIKFFGIGYLLFLGVIFAFFWYNTKFTIGFFLFPWKVGFNILKWLTQKASCTACQKANISGCSSAGSCGTFSEK